MNKVAKILATQVPLIFLLLLVSCNPKEKNRELFSTYEGQQGFYIMKIPPALFLGIVSSNSEQSFDPEKMGNIDYIKLLIFSQSQITEFTTDEIASDLMEKMNDIGYEIMLSLNSNGSDVSVYILDNEEYVSDLMIMVKEDSSFTGLGLSGKLSLKAISDFATNVDIGEIDGLLDMI